jgi:hypothetical protein
LTSREDDPGFDRSYVEEPDEFYLRQGDVIPDVPLVVAPPRIIAIERPTRLEDDELRTRVVGLPPSGGSGYGIVQIAVARCIVLTYDCDIDRGLESIADGRDPDPVENMTVCAVIPVTSELYPKLADFRRGRMPRFAYLPSTIEREEYLIDFSTIQQMSLRILVPLAYGHRTFGLTNNGQLRLMERLAHSLGDVFRRARGADPGDASLLRRAHQVLAGN